MEDHAKKQEANEKVSSMVSNKLPDHEIVCHARVRGGANDMHWATFPLHADVIELELAFAGV